MNIEQRQVLPRSELLQVANHCFFITALLFVAHQNTLHDPAHQHVRLFVAQASSLQPQTPPPAVDPEEMSVDEVELPSSRDGVLTRVR